MDIVFDTLGKEYTLDAFELIKKGGKVVSIMGPLDKEGAELFKMKDYEIPQELRDLIKSKDATYKYIWMHPDGEELGQIKTLVEEGKIKPVIDKVYPFSQSAEALIHLGSGRAKGKIVVTIG